MTTETFGARVRRKRLLLHLGLRDTAKRADFPDLSVTDRDQRRESRSERGRDSEAGRNPER